MSPTSPTDRCSTPKEASAAARLSGISARNLHCGAPGTYRGPRPGQASDQCRAASRVADSRLDVVLLDTAPEADSARGIGYLRRSDWALVPVKGAEEASVQAIGPVLEWLEAATNCRLVGFLPTMATPRWAESRLWMDELQRLERSSGASLFAPIPARASLAARLDGHRHAPLTKEILRAVCP